MKITGWSAIGFLFAALILCGCIQITINPQVPALPATSPKETPVPIAVLPTVTAAPTAEMTPLPADTASQVSATPSSSGSSENGFITPVSDVTRTGYRTFTFLYGPKEYTLRVPVNMSVYYGAKAQQVVLPQAQDIRGIREYLRTYGSDPAMDELYDNLLVQLRNCRYQDGGNLTDDQYLELITAFVQQIPYEQNTGSKRKYPIEVIYDKAGDSDEKSQLLAHLLSREGYDVAYLVFTDLGYETLGIRVVKDLPDASLRVFSNGQKDYVFIDAAVSRFIGSVPDAFAEADDPVIYPVGNGTKTYGDINYVWKIVADLKAINRMGALNGTTIRVWDKYATCTWIKNSKLLFGKTCYCCDM